MGTLRLVELWISARHIRTSGVVLEGALSRRTYPAMVALHTCVLATVALWGRAASPPGVAFLAALQAARWWIILLLGSRWNTRGAVPPSMAVEQRGPYRLVRHPNYTLVWLELAVLPLTFGLRGLALLATLANTVLLAARVRDEERALRQVDGYEEFAASRARFIPWVF